MGFILFLIASIIKWLFAPIGYFIGCVFSLFKREFNTYHTDLAIAKDQYGNAICKYIFNWLLIKKQGYCFGNVDETIGSVIGKNKVRGTLTRTGKVLDFLLELCESDHSIKSIDNSEDNPFK